MLPEDKSVTPSRPITAALVIRSTLFTIGMFLSTALWAPLIVIASPLPFSVRYRLSQQWSRFNIWWLNKTCDIDYQLEGLEQLPTEPVVVLAKHQSAWETIFFHQLLPPLAWVIKRELLWIPFFGWAMGRLRPIAINRAESRAALMQLLRQGQARLNSGLWVLIFPEGTRTAPGASGEYHSGGAFLATRSGYAVLPIAHNAGEHWSRRGFLKYPGTIRVRFGPLMDSKGYKPKELNQRVERWIENAMAQLSGLSPHATRPATSTEDR
ncbi:MAG: 1-acyl-sn-glycerol-3-phosphate acyltransferase [Gammaproteobacteria bacterium]|nr:1-acyl-sn-glycerol-3-phosphate acyltransferase [Gammaproteobacteria bacterium]MCP5424434.1 1-acyl-sn-glycerol-3-phosphate acyltransferase [Gammaproteobacteria bacterium]MCP5458428.1 1-acyl-sn-glycerol-3-phosphate acyltransferase [Gammaproteobacteria bacterium]